MNNEISKAGRTFSSVTASIAAAIIPDTPIVSIAGATLCDITTTTTSTTTTPTPTPTSFEATKPPPPAPIQQATHNSMTDDAAAANDAANADDVAAATAVKDICSDNDNEITKTTSTTTPLNDGIDNSHITTKPSSLATATPTASNKSKLDTGFLTKINSTTTKTTTTASASATTATDIISNQERKDETKNIDDTNEDNINHLDEQDLKNLLHEAYTYHNPRDRESKSLMFQKLLKETENTKEERTISFRAIPSRFTRNTMSLSQSSSSSSSGNNRAQETGGSLQDFMDAFHTEGENEYLFGNRTRRITYNARQKKYTSVSSRQREGGSLPSNVNACNLSANALENATSSWKQAKDKRAAAVEEQSQDDANNKMSKVNLEIKISSEKENVLASASYNVRGRSNEFIIDMNSIQNIQQQQQILNNKSLDATAQGLPYYERMDSMELRIPRPNVISSGDNSTGSGGECYVDDKVRFGSMERSANSNTNLAYDSKYMPLDENNKACKSVMGDKNLSAASLGKSSVSSLAHQYDDTEKQSVFMRGLAWGQATSQAMATTSIGASDGATTASTSSGVTSGSTGGGGQTKTKSKKKSQQERNTKTVDVQSVEGYRGNDPVEDLVKYIESSADKQKDNKKRERKQRDKQQSLEKQHKLKKSNSLEELRSASKIDMDECVSAATTENNVLMRHKNAGGGNGVAASGAKNNKNTSASNVDINKHFGIYVAPKDKLQLTTASERRSWGTEGLNYLAEINAFDDGNKCEKIEEKTDTPMPLTDVKIVEIGETSTPKSPAIATKELISVVTISTATSTVNTATTGKDEKLVKTEKQKKVENSLVVNMETMDIDILAKTAVMPESAEFHVVTKKKKPKKQRTHENNIIVPITNNNNIKNNENNTLSSGYNGSRQNSSALVATTTTTIAASTSSQSTSLTNTTTTAANNNNNMHNTTTLTTINGKNIMAGNKANNKNKMLVNNLANLSQQQQQQQQQNKNICNNLNKNVNNQNAANNNNNNQQQQQRMRHNQTTNQQQQQHDNNDDNLNNNYETHNNNNETNYYNQHDNLNYNNNNKKSNEGENYKNNNRNYLNKHNKVHESEDSSENNYEQQQQQPPPIVHNKANNNSKNKNNKNADIVVNSSNAKANIKAKSRRKSTCSMPTSDKSDSSDAESVHSLPTNNNNNSNSNNTNNNNTKYNNNNNNKNKTNNNNIANKNQQQRIAKQTQQQQQQQQPNTTTITKNVTATQQTSVATNKLPDDIIIPTAVAASSHNNKIVANTPQLAIAAPISYADIARTHKPTKSTTTTTSSSNNNNTNNATAAVVKSKEMPTASVEREIVAIPSILAATTTANVEANNNNNNNNNNNISSKTKANKKTVHKIDFPELVATTNVQPAVHCDQLQQQQQQEQMTASTNTPSNAFKLISYSQRLTGESIDFMDHADDNNATDTKMIDDNKSDGLFYTIDTSVPPPPLPTSRISRQQQQQQAHHQHHHQYQQQSQQQNINMTKAKSVEHEDICSDLDQQYPSLEMSLKRHSSAHIGHHPYVTSAAPNEPSFLSAPGNVVVVVPVPVPMPSTQSSALTCCAAAAPSTSSAGNMNLGQGVVSQFNFAAAARQHIAATSRKLLNNNNDNNNVVITSDAGVTASSRKISKKDKQKQQQQHDLQLASDVIVHKLSTATQTHSPTDKITIITTTTTSININTNTLANNQNNNNNTTSCAAARPAVIILNDERNNAVSNDSGGEFTFGDFNEDELSLFDDNDDKEAEKVTPVTVINNKKAKKDLAMGKGKTNVEPPQQQQQERETASVVCCNCAPVRPQQLETCNDIETAILAAARAAAAQKEKTSHQAIYEDDVNVDADNTADMLDIQGGGAAAAAAEEEEEEEEEEEYESWAQASAPLYSSFAEVVSAPTTNNMNNYINNNHNQNSHNYHHHHNQYHHQHHNQQQHHQNQPQQYSQNLMNENQGRNAKLMKTHGPSLIMSIENDNFNIFYQQPPPEAVNTKTALQNNDAYVDFIASAWHEVVNSRATKHYDGE